ncbi:MAG: GTP-binding protein [Clostridia bacterium]
MKIINLGIFAHVDAGKTTLTENILLDSHLTKELGKVEKQTSHVDTMDLERSMGITIQSTSVRIELENTVINLIDTPGHADLYSEVERVIPVIDGAVVIVSAVEGVQAQTVKILSLLQSQGVRILFFINKLDAVGADASAVIDDIHEQLNVETLVMQTWDTDGKSLLVKRRLDEALFDELQAKSAEKQATSLSVLLLQRNIMPVFVGSAKLSVGIGMFMGDYQFHTGTATARC